MKYTPIAIAVVVLVAIIGLFTSMYIVTEKDQVFITRFGKIQGGATEGGIDGPARRICNW